MSAWPKALAAVLLAAAGWSCTENVVAPGHCPEACTAESVQQVDTVLTGVIASDTSYRGYVTPEESSFLVMSNTPQLQAAAIMRFAPRPSFWVNSVGDTVQLNSIDSVLFTVHVLKRDTTVTTSRIIIYQVPLSAVDTNATYASITSYLTPANLVDSIVIDSVIEDSLDGSVRKLLPTSAFTPDTVSADSGRVAAVLVVRADTPTVMSIGAVDISGLPTTINWYARGADTTQIETFTATPEFDSFVQTPLPPAASPTSMFVGGLPSSRALIRFAIPSYFIDSTTIVRGTLVMTPTSPVVSLPVDTFTLEAHGVLRDYGPKSYPSSSAVFGTAGRFVAGDSGTVNLDLTQILRSWRGVSVDSLPRSIIVIVVEEGTTLGSIALARSGTGAIAPVLHLTYIKPYVFGVP